ncbi:MULTISPECIES: amino acid ABC transporter substrate-binding protein [unclassified Pseudodesulfovibrio]|uniref:amino acid ABC transporter substrate-binding protein n=1 Tax=unclassified Pseudodesulfovibrio TaxID=2661612 RepID=UPI000FEBC1D8|nr:MULTISPECIES: amino acid ABC transporter substrate-binding protein [unclassified Pseudodesulfovibrio]MCJ2165590.1 amino acid ABC transporter substrate-binding protein [Pseudodesulfovibrio sp. S3-i]RWU02998.1 amino acid ABC transporter substrate-binding protein [Pseudodesulfovibrio sp. S3]
MKTIGKILLAVLMLAMATTAMAGTLEKVQQNKELILGVSEGVAGFSAPDSNGRWTGFDVDMGHAVAAAVLKDPDAIKFVPLASKQKIVAVSSGQVDLSRGTTWTMKRDGKQGVDFTVVLFYDGQGLMVKKSLGVSKATDLDGASVAVVSGTTSELNVADFARANNIKLETVVFDSKKEAFNAYVAGRTDAFTTDVSQLASLRAGATDSDQHIILPEVFSKEPLSPFVRHGDNQWKDLVTWVLFGLIEAEEKGITQANVLEMKKTSTDPMVQRMLGATGDIGTFVNLDNDWLVRAIQAVGNYGEMYNRNFGPDTALKIPRGHNNLWTKGGLIYAMPIR